MKNSSVSCLGGMVIGKLMILSFSDAEEHILDKLKTVFEDEKDIECTKNVQTPVLRFHELEIHIKEQEVYQREERVPLSHQEFLVLCFLTEHPGWVCTKEQIYNAVYDDEKIVDIDNAVYCLVRSIRKKLKKEYIQTVRGVGYKFRIPEE